MLTFGEVWNKGTEDHHWVISEKPKVSIPQSKWKPSTRNRIRYLPKSAGKWKQSDLGAVLWNVLLINLKGSGRVALCNFWLKVTENQLELTKDGKRRLYCFI